MGKKGRREGGKEGGRKNRGERIDGRIRRVAMVGYDE